MNLKPLISFVAIAGLAACGGGTVGVGGGGGAGGGTTFESVLSDFRTSSVIDEATATDGELITFEALSAGGSASYTGSTLLFLADDFDEISGQPEVDIEGIEDLPDPSLVGSVNLTTTFSGDGGTVEGAFTDFIDRDGNTKSGSLTLANGESGDFFGTAAFGAEFNGTLTGAGLGSRSYDGELLGFFTPDDGVVGIGAESLEDDVNDDASFALIFVAEQ